MLNLPSVTLLAIDTTPNPERTREAMDKCLSLATFGAEVFVTEGPTDYEAYNRFVVCEMYRHFETEHVLLIQHDGYILNPDAWQDSWLRWDYIGAPWYPYGPNRSVVGRVGGIVGNGGFSLRSKRFCEATARVAEYKLALDPAYRFAPEDQLICNGPGWDAKPDPDFNARLLRRGMKFAPVNLASTFSWERHDNDPAYAGQFGFHGKHSLEWLEANGIEV